MSLLTSTEKIANPSMLLKLYDGFEVQMRQLTIRRQADLDAYARGKFMQNTLKALVHVEPEYHKQVIQEMATAAQTLIWADRAATVIFETEEDGLAYYCFKHIEEDFKGDYNEWKVIFNKHREENAKLFYVARWALYFSNHPVMGNQPKNPNDLYDLVDEALDAGLPLNIALESTPSQINMLIGDRKAMQHLAEGRIQWRDQEEFRAWFESQKLENKEEDTNEEEMS